MTSFRAVRLPSKKTLMGNSRYIKNAPLIKISPRTDDEIKNEPMLFNCDLRHAYLYGGNITLEILNTLPSHWRDCPLVIDSRVHMLMPGWYPCIPGWHHDDVPRAGPHNQPDYTSPLRSQHMMMLINADIAPTQFACGEYTVEYPEEGEVLYKHWHPQIEQQIAQDCLFKTEAEDRKWYLFDDNTWHQGTPARKNGWRFFIRVSRYFDSEKQEFVPRGNPRTNEVRRQVQVYPSDINGGW